MKVTRRRVLTVVGVAAAAVVAGLVAAAGLRQGANAVVDPMSLGTESEAIEPVLAAGERAFRQTAPFDGVAPGAYSAAVSSARKKPKTAGTWQPLGGPALYADNPDYAGADPVVTAGPSRLGWSKLSGRVTSFAYDPANTRRVFAGPAAGGVWESTDGGDTWRSIGDGLPTQAMGSVGFLPAGGGTIIAGTGDNAVGGVITPSGLGVYTSTDDGRTWTKATGVPDGLVTFTVAVDPTNPGVDYVATSRGLFRSLDGGRSYANVDLPTPKVVNGVTTPSGCAGDTTSAACTYATVVTDVAVQPGTGAVIAAVGWVAGQAVNAVGIMQAPQNGIYTSPTGAPGTFAFQNPGASAPTANGFAPTPVVGRTSLAVASGPAQDHGYVYALVQDAKKLQGCFNTAADLPLCTGTGVELSAEATFLDAATSRPTSARPGRRSCPGSSSRLRAAAARSRGARSSATGPGSSPGTTTGSRSTRRQPTR
jgi:hypothetical protein